MTFDPAVLAATLADAHRDGRQVDAGTLSVPPDLEAALTVHPPYAARLQAETGGWKVGIAPDGTAIGAPLFKNLFADNGATVAIPASGWMGIEAEIALVLGTDLPARAGGHDREAILAATEAVLVGIELVDSRIRDFKSAPYPLFVADLMANRGYVCGRPVRDFGALALDSLRCTVTAAGKTLHDAVGGHANGDPLLPAVAFASRPQATLGGLRKGQVVTLGSVCGMLPVADRGPVRVTMEGLGEVGITLA